VSRQYCTVKACCYKLGWFQTSSCAVQLPSPQMVHADSFFVFSWHIVTCMTYRLCLFNVQSLRCKCTYLRGQRWGQAHASLPHQNNSEATQQTWAHAAHSGVTHHKGLRNAIYDALPFITILQSWPSPTAPPRKSIGSIPWCELSHWAVCSQMLRPQH
jgi:hypothetical protein